MNDTTVDYQRMNHAMTANVIPIEGFWRFEMSPMLVVLLSAAAPVAGLGLLQLQARLERWDYERHAED
ncbi:hypothetical protein C0J29_04620 [Mycobacterium paragordonae]|jgi:hypothetical protein|uniref:Uncharacterized protein n=1 Tax=Mycobacterium paragordonae TaxID=1389713 RepID=A0A386U1J9_9MYCO|nr:MULTISPECIES: hypothetical protein [Mycobacterium]PJE23895.1 MAG: hypothetical protein CK431_08825 [Mycobacterium sp.]AYE94181.1 hypothetical protein C0J29_04620 [Mycobacterium paragordonae]MDP7737098.1 hypothetical protein [Mycobacterium paragordonae]OBK44089.1 hypothetical protein A5656_06270 [Mycobacterium gordonae]TDK94201.1 hypothetical protein EUA02_18430 [Mycobacterium paragordonae]